MDAILESAMFYHNEGLCVIPVVFRDKKPAIDWMEYQTRRSTPDEIKAWFGNGHRHNIGIVHGPVSDNFVSIDIDHDAGVMANIRSAFPDMVKGRMEQSGSGEGFHIPLRLDILPDFGIDTKGKTRGNMTWKTGNGNVNIRVRDCQTVVPPSIHPSGGRYRFLQKGGLVKLPNLDSFISWLDASAPKNTTVQKAIQAKRINNDTTGGDLLDIVLKSWPDVLAVFEAFGMANSIEYERDGQIRLPGNGGLLLTEDRQQWYCFEHETGGGVTQAWGWCKYGNDYDPKRQFRDVLFDMAITAGIDTTVFATKKEELPPVEPTEVLPILNGDALSNPEWMTVLVQGEPAVNALRRLGFNVVGIPGEVLNPEWVKYFKDCQQVFVAFDYSSEQHGRQSAQLLSRVGIDTKLCLLPCSIEEFFYKFGGNSKEFFLFLMQGIKA